MPCFHCWGHGWVQSLVGELRSIKMASWPNESGPWTDPTALFSSPLPLWSFHSLGQKQVQLRAPWRSQDDHDHFGNRKNSFHFWALIVMSQDLSMNPLTWSSPPPRMYCYSHSTDDQMEAHVVIQLLSHVWLFAAPCTIVHQSSLCMGFLRQEYWSRLSFPSPRDLSRSRIKSTSRALVGRFFTTEPPGKSTMEYYSVIKKNEIGSFAATKVDLEIIILSEASQKEKDKYHMIYVEPKIWHKWTYLWNRDRIMDIEKIYWWLPKGGGRKTPSWYGLVVWE